VPATVGLGSGGRPAHQPLARPVREVPDGLGRPALDDDRAVSVFVLLALFALTQLPAGSNQSWVAGVLVRINPVGSGLHYLSGLVVEGHGWTTELSYLASPVIAAVVAGVGLMAVGPRFVRLTGGVSG
jgi:ABC-2 type transport system permease protein